MNYKNDHSGISYRASAKRIARALSVIIPLCFFSLLISLFIAFSANDIYAFVKPRGAVTLELDGARALPECAELLEEHGVIKSPALFTLYVKSRGAEAQLTSAVGTLSLDTSMSYREILREFQKIQSGE